MNSPSRPQFSIEHGEQQQAQIRDLLKQGVVWTQACGTRVVSGMQFIERLSMGDVPLHALEIGQRLVEQTQIIERSTALAPVIQSLGAIGEVLLGRIDAQLDPLYLQAAITHRANIVTLQETMARYQEDQTSAPFRAAQRSLTFLQSQAQLAMLQRGYELLAEREQPPVLDVAAAEPDVIVAPKARRVREARGETGEDLVDQRTKILTQVLFSAAVGGNDSEFDLPGMVQAVINTQKEDLRDALQQNPLEANVLRAKREWFPYLLKKLRLYLDARAADPEMKPIPVLEDLHAAVQLVAPEGQGEGDSITRARTVMTNFLNTQFARVQGVTPEQAVAEDLTAIQDDLTQANAEVPADPLTTVFGDETLMGFVDALVASGVTPIPEDLDDPALAERARVVGLVTTHVESIIMGIFSQRGVEDALNLIQQDIPLDRFSARMGINNFSIRSLLRMMDQGLPQGSAAELKLTVSQAVKALIWKKKHDGSFPVTMSQEDRDEFALVDEVIPQVLAAKRATAQEE